MMHGAAVSVPIHIRETSESRICFERSGTDNVATPVVNLGFSLKIPVQELVNALLEFHKNEAVDAAKASPHEPPKPKTLSVAQLADRMNPSMMQHGMQNGMPPGGMPVGMPPPPPPPPPPSNIAPLRNDGWQQIPPPAFQREQDPAVTWDSDISLLQPNHEDYVKRTRWKVADQRGRQSFVLDVESSLTSYVPRVFMHDKVTPKDPGMLPTERPAGSPPGSGPPQPGVANQASKDAEAEKNAQDGASGAAIDASGARPAPPGGAPPMPPPGLPSPGAAGTSPHGKGAGGQQAAGQDGAKECKQQ